MLKNLGEISFKIGLSVLIDLRSFVRIPFMNLKYCSIRGLSSPYFERIASISCFVAPSPAIMRAGSPGIMCIIENDMIETPIITGIRSNNLLEMNLITHNTPQTMGCVDTPHKAYLSIQVYVMLKRSVGYIFRSLTSFRMTVAIFISYKNIAGAS